MNTGIMLYTGQDIQYNKYKQTKGKLKKKTFMDKTLYIRVKYTMQHGEETKNPAR